MNAEDAFFQSQDPGKFFASGPASMVLTQLERGLEDASPVVVLTGESGVGKTTVVREAIACWGDRVHAVWFEVEVGPPEKTLLKTIRAFGGHGRAKDERPELIARMAHALNGITERGSTPLLIVDDAHQYAIEMLAEVGRIESAAIAADQTLKLLLVGEPRLTDLLDREELDIITQRLAVSCRLEPMEQADTRQYLNHRVGATGGSEESNAFSRKAAREIHAITRGVPSAINALAAEAQRRANTTNAGVVTPDHVRAVMAAARRVAGTTSPYEPVTPPEPRVRPLPAATPPAPPKPAAAAPPSVPQRSAAQTPSGQHSRPAPNVPPAPKPAQPTPPRSSKPNTPGGPRQAEPVPPKVKRVPPPPPPAQPVGTPEPAVDLDSSHPRVKEWVSRFTDGQPLRIGGAMPPPPITDPSTLPDVKPIFADDDELLAAPAEAPAPPAPKAPPLDELLNPPVAGPLPVAAAPAPVAPARPPAAPPDPHAVELLKDEPLISAEALTPPPLVLDEKPAEATPSGSMKRPAGASQTPPQGTPKPLIAKPAPRPSGSMQRPSGSMQRPSGSMQRPSGSMPKPKLPSNVSAAPPQAPPQVPTSAKAPAPQKGKHQPPAVAPKPAPSLAAASPVEPPALLTKKDVKAHKPEDFQKAPKPATPRLPDPDAMSEDEEYNLPSPTVYRVLAALIPIVLILGMAATAIVLSRKSAFDREPETTDAQASAPSAVSESVQAVPAVPSAPLAPSPPPLVVTPDSEVTPATGATSDSDVTPAPAAEPKFCLSVGTYLFSDRARQRTEQLQRRTHMKSWIITTTADGSYTYRVMLGGFATRAEAERIADKLLSSGLVSEALVEPLPPQ